MKHPHLDSLDAVRWVASVQIVASHIYPEMGTLAEQGKLFTQMFFVLSGFVLAFAEMLRQPSNSVKGMGILKYHLKRLSSLYPAYAFCLCAQAFLIGNSRSFPALTAFQKMLFPLSLLLGQSIVVICHPDFPHVYQASCFQWNSPTWFISALTIYWMTLRPVAAFFRDMPLKNACLWWALFWCLSYLPEILSLCIAVQHNGNAWGDCRVYSLSHGCLGYFQVFFGGVVLARIFILTCCKDADTNGPLTTITRTLVLAPDKAHFALRYGCVIGYVLYYILVCNLQFPLDTTIFFVLHNGGLLPVFCLIIIGASLGEDPIAKYFFNTPLLRLLGRISVYQYLLQFIVRDYIVASFPGFGINWSLNGRFIYPVLLLASSILLELYVQKPLQKIWERHMVNGPFLAGRCPLTEKTALISKDATVEKTLPMGSNAVKV